VRKPMSEALALVYKKQRHNHHGRMGWKESHSGENEDTSHLELQLDSRIPRYIDPVLKIV
jgi:hypothetical protein